MMKTVTTIHNGVVLLVVLLIALSILATSPAQAADSHVEGTMVLSPIEKLGVPKGEHAVTASGAAEDTLKACRARIPELASVGQHMLAEQTCAGEEAARKAMRSAPKF
jgi:hypothetical protein